ncbi:MAG: quinone-dependent dihydroorotate dehydrogenase [Alphaproteobacteria bacterium]|nr:MAG: quinone-dependent dihydroorotate dehydrogenase [Alphaproteobacteria bacterium]
MNLYRAIRPFLFQLPGETAHRLTLTALGALPPGNRPTIDRRLAVNRFGLHFASPIGLAAGFDKDGIAADRLFRFGFGFVELGTTTPRAQAGNPPPRLFRLVEDRALINRLGFNNQGHAVMARNLEAMRHRLAHRRAGPIGVNIGANKDSADRIADYLAGLERFAGPADYLTVNVSSPNTPGLRDLQLGEALDRLLTSLSKAREKLSPAVPLLLKIAPDLDDRALAEIATLAMRHDIDGVIISNTTVSRPPGLRSAKAREAGGLSGAPLMPLATDRLACFYRLSEGRIPLIGVGGVMDAEDAWAKIRAGASLIQLYSGLVYEGPGLVRRILDGMLRLMERDGFAHLDEAVGADHRKD